MDPYNVFGISNLINYEIKLKNGCNLNPCLWKTVEFKAGPVNKLILGDSRTANLDTVLIYRTTGEKYFNFGYGGGSLPEVIDTFWFATQQVKLEKVYIGLNLNVYNANYSRNRFKEAEKIIQNKLLYFINMSALNSIVTNLQTQLFNSKIASVPAMDKEAFWDSQLGYYTKSLYMIYSHPDDYLSELKRIAAYCKANNIKLVFIIYPTHQDLQRKVAEYKLNAAEKIFKEDIKALGRVYDFDYPNDFTRDKANFSDPYHVKDYQFIVDEVWAAESFAPAQQ